MVGKSLKGSERGMRERSDKMGRTHGQTDDMKGLKNF